MTAPAAPPSAQLILAANVVPGPNGVPIVVLMIGNGGGPLGFQVQMEYQNVPGLRDLLNAKLDEAYETARRQASGLIIPDVSRPQPGTPNGARFVPPAG